jgi:hypothetical protein
VQGIATAVALRSAGKRAYVDGFGTIRELNPVGGYFRIVEAADRLRMSGNTVKRKVGSAWVDTGVPINVREAVSTSTSTTDELPKVEEETTGNGTATAVGLTVLALGGLWWASRRKGGRAEDWPRYTTY